MASLIIGLLGLKQSGKDTFASRLVEEHGFTRVAFADPLKAAALQLNPIIRLEDDEMGPVGLDRFFSSRYWRLAPLVKEVGWETAKSVREVRRTLQDLGVSIRDNVDRDAWLDAAKANVSATRGPVVITDVRFPNEVMWAERAGTTIRIVRPGQEATDTHVSETAVADHATDYTVLNDGTIAKLHHMADVLVKVISA